ncbi:MAG: hypothetical protein AB8E15_06980 [Bdellovibrionales bacterium]
MDRTFLKIGLISIALSLLVSCGGEFNLFSASADKNSDKALLYDANRALEAKDFETAISKIQSMSTAAQAEDDTLRLLGSAYGGQCGLEFVPFQTGFSDSSDTLSNFLLTHFEDADVDSQTACKNAETAFDGISADGLTQSDYIARVYLAMSKIGSIVNTEGALVDNTLDPGFDPCSDIPSSFNAETGDQAKELFTALVRLFTNLASAGLDTAVSALPPAIEALLTDTDIADVDSSEEKLALTVINANEIGLDVCGADSSDVGCVCP